MPAWKTVSCEVLLGLGENVFVDHVLSASKAVVRCEAVRLEIVIKKLRRYMLCSMYFCPLYARRECQYYAISKEIHNSVKMFRHLMMKLYWFTDHVLAFI